MRNCAIIGNGYWSFILRKYIPKYFNINYIADSTTNLNMIWEDKNIKYIFIVTPNYTHYDLAKKSLKAGKHTFVEKPTTTNLMQYEELVKIAKNKNLTLFTDYPYFYSNIFRSLQNITNITCKIYRNTSGKYDNVNVHEILTPHILSLIHRYKGYQPVQLHNIDLHNGWIFGQGIYCNVSLTKENKTEITLNGKEYIELTEPLKNVVLEFALNKSNINLSRYVIEIIERHYARGI